MIAIILGPDAATCRSESKKLAAAYDADGSNTNRLDGRSIRLAEAISMVGTPPFFGSGRVVIVDDLLARFSRANDEEGIETGSTSPKGALAVGELSSLFLAVHPDNLLILVDQSLSSAPAAITKLLPKNAQVLTSDPPRGHALIEWMQSQARAIDSNIEREAAQTLAEALFPQTWSAKPSNPRFDRPPDLDQLSNELAKLALFAHPDAIGVSHVRQLAETASAERLFPFVEHSVAGNLATAIRDLESFDVHGDDGHRASNQLFQQIELSTVLATAPIKNDPAAVGRDLGLSNSNRMFGVARAPRPAMPAESVLRATIADRSVKTGKLKDIADSIYSLLTWFAEAKQESANRRGKS
ncbi:MAG: DNA polymerase III subunit delta [Thermomicrobiales bacterium]